jgi:hypothetical protein
MKSQNPHIIITHTSISSKQKSLKNPQKMNIFLITGGTKRVAAGGRGHPRKIGKLLGYP